MQQGWGIGSDIIEIQRIRLACHRHAKFITRHFTAGEIAYCARYRDPFPHYAGHLAAKEAVAKALGTGICATLSWLQIDIQHTHLGQPTVHLEHVHGSILLTISHCKDYATSTALWMP